MPTVVGIRFKKAGKIYYFDPALSSVAQGDHAIVETARGVEYGEVVVGPREVSDSEVVSPLKPVLRKATDEDAQKVEENIVREKEAFNICLRKITNHDLPMRLIDVEFTFDVNKIIFYFTAEGRIDFRELVKDLAAVRTAHFQQLAVHMQHVTVTRTLVQIIDILRHQHKIIAERLFQTRQRQVSSVGSNFRLL